MNNYVKKQTSITPDELLNGESLSVDGTSTEQEEEKTPEAQFYRGYVDAVFDLEEGNKKRYEAHEDKTKHYLAGYEAAVKYDAEITRLSEKRAYYNQKLKEWKQKHNCK